jgi:hypothetical protein
MRFISWESFLKIEINRGRHCEISGQSEEINAFKN